MKRRQTSLRLIMRLPQVRAVDSFATFRLFILLGLCFGPLAGIMAFLITYEEYSRHQFERRRLIAMSVRAGATSFLAILVVLALAGYILGLASK